MCKFVVGVHLDDLSIKKESLTKKITVYERYTGTPYVSTAEYYKTTVNGIDYEFQTSYEFNNFLQRITGMEVFDYCIIGEWYCLKGANYYPQIVIEDVIKLQERVNESLSLKGFTVSSKLYAIGCDD